MPYPLERTTYSQRHVLTGFRWFGPGKSALFAIFALAFACAGVKPPYIGKGPAPQNAGDRAVAHLADQFLDDMLKASPVTASYRGYHKWDRLLPDVSPGGVDRTIAMLTSYQRQLHALDRAKLSPSWQVDRDLIDERIQSELFTLTELKPLEWDVQLYNEIIGGAFYYLTKPPEDKTKWKERLEAVLARMEALPHFLEQAKKNLQHPPRVFTEFVIKQNPGNIDVFEKQLPDLFAASSTLIARFQAEQPKVVKALKDYQAFLEGELLARSTGDWRIGKERWEKKLALTLGTKMTVDQSYAAAEKALDATRLQMYDLALPLFKVSFPTDEAYNALGGDARINYVVSRVIAEASKEHGTPESIFDDVNGYAQKIKAFIQEKDLIALPPQTDRFVIERTPSFLDGLAIAFYNPAPAFEPDLKKSFWISTVPKAGTADAESFLREYNHYTLQAVTIHEAFPGHYVQLYWSSHSPFASITKEALESGTMSEGWACMIEQVLHEQGYSKGDPKNALFHLKMRLRFFLNAMIDAKLHTSTGDEKELDRWALELLEQKGFQEEAEATRKLRRAKLSSVQLSTYFVGYKEMLEIYRAAEQKAGPAAKVRPILEKMISYGTIPPRMIRRLMTAEGQLK